MLTATQRFSDAVLDATDLRGHVRRHPLGALALGLTFGALAGPGLLRRLGRIRLPPVVLAALTRRITRHLTED